MADNPTSNIPPRTVHRQPPKTDEPPRRTFGQTVKDRAQAVKKDLSARAQTAKELIGLACLPLAGAAAIHTARQGDPNAVSPFSLDVATIHMHGDALAEAIAELSETYPVLGNTLDRIAMLTPAASIFGVGVLIAMQIAENHGRLSDQAREFSPVPIVPRDELAGMLREQIGARESAAAAGNGA